VILDEYLAIGSLTAAVRSTVATVGTDRHASMNSFFITTSMDDHDEEKKREQNLFCTQQ